jgi:riboflavin kinase/FMN adenylyltransferase
MMIRYRLHADAPGSASSGTAVTIGNFDGVHKGHCELFGLISRAAKQEGLRSAVLTFEPHPRAFFNAALAPAKISGLRDRLAWIKAFGIDEVHILHFDQHLAGQSPAQFIDQVLVKRLNTRHLWVGDDFKFGHKRSGDFATLTQAGKNLGFKVDAIQSVLHEDERISSTEIRKRLAQGDIEQATSALGHPLTYSGHVLHGQKLGRTLGFPTLNLGLGTRTSALSGILAVWVHGLEETPLPGVASLGVRPSVKSNGEYWLETYVFDWKGDAYGKKISVEVVKHLRHEAKFDSLDDMVVQMNKDKAAARAYLVQHPATAPLFTLNRSATA